MHASLDRESPWYTEQVQAQAWVQLQAVEEQKQRQQTSYPDLGAM